MKFYIYCYNDEMDFSTKKIAYYVYGDKLHVLSFDGYYIGSFNSVMKLGDMNLFMSFKRLGIKEVEKLKKGFVRES